MFAEGGYGGVTMEIVAQKAKISKETLYEVFPSKTALFKGVMDELITSWASGLRGQLAEPPEHTLRAELSHFLHIMLEGRFAAHFSVMARLFREERHRFPELEERQAWITRLVEIVIGGASAW